jgi:hypothetical protein
MHKLASKNHWGAAKHLLRYLGGTTDLTLTFDAKASQTAHHQDASNSASSSRFIQRIIKTLRTAHHQSLHTARHQVASYSASSSRFIPRVIKSLHTAHHQVAS